MIRVVLDTNILISALLQPQGLPARAFLITLAGSTTQLCVSGDIYAEYEEVIRRPKFNRNEAIVEQALRAQDFVRAATKHLFKPGRSAAQTCAQIRK
jgi:putative PIN family toxin of toxin-antitoxin system